MDMIIKSLVQTEVDKLINQDSDIYARILEPSVFSELVDVQISIKTLAVDENHLIIEYPNGNVAVVNIASTHYFKIEVL